MKWKHKSHTNGIQKNLKEKRKRRLHVTTQEIKSRTYSTLFSAIKNNAAFFHYSNNVVVSFQYVVVVVVVVRPRSLRVNPENEFNYSHNFHSICWLLQLLQLAFSLSQLFQLIVVSIVNCWKIYSVRWFLEAILIQFILRIEIKFSFPILFWLLFANLTLLTVYAYFGIVGTC